MIHFGYSTFIIGNTGDIVANVFTRETSQVEELKQISFPIWGGNKNTVYEIYVNSQDGELTDSSKLKLVKTVTNIGDMGYYTFAPDNKVTLTGTKYVVAVKYKVIDGTEFSIPLEAITIDVPTWGTAISGVGESYIYRDSWMDLYSTSIPGITQKSACIKAFTEEENKMTVKLTSSAYEVNETGNMVSKISPNTTVSGFIGKVSSAGTIKIYKNGTEVTGTAIVGTGMEVRFTENVSKKYQIAVTGDLTGDGQITGSDLIKIKRKIVGLENLSEIYEKAADVNFVGGITGSDLIKIKRQIVGLENI